MPPLSLSRYLLLLVIVLLAGCSTTRSSDHATQGVEQSLAAAGLRETNLGAASLMRAWYRSTPEAPSAWHIYVEGDGQAWRGAGRPSSNPTPRQPVAMRLALEDPHSHVAYLARPCQFLQPLPAGCHFSLWTTQRYGSDVEEQMLAALNAIAGDQSVRLIGFSGGAHLAQQLAQRHPNVELLISVAGNLHDASFAQHHRLPAPQNAPPPPGDIPFYSLAGGNDDIIPPSLARQQLDRQARGCHQLVVHPQAEHTGPWQLDWYSIEAFLDACR